MVPTSISPGRAQRVLIALTLAVTGSLAVAVAAFAAGINPGQVPTTAAQFASKSCADPFDDLDANQDGWHFVVPSSQGDAFISLTLTFNTPGGPVVVGPVLSTDENAPTMGAGWHGWFDNAGTDSKHAYVVTPAGWTLTGGDAALLNEEPGATFNLSHVCAGLPPSPSPSPSLTKSPKPSHRPSKSPEASHLPSESPSESPSASPSESPSESPHVSPSVTPTSPSVSPAPGLPVTGASVAGMLAAGAGLVLAGAVLLMSQLRRRREE